MKAIVCRNLPQALSPESENVCTLIDRVVTLFGSVDHEIAGYRPHAAIFNACRDTVSRTLQRDQIRLRATTRERAETLWTIFQQIAQPADHARFDHRRSWTIAPRAGILIEHRRKRVGPYADGQRRRIELAEVSRARDAHRVWSNLVFETCKDLFERDSLLRQRFVEEFFELSGCGFRRHSA